MGVQSTLTSLYFWRAVLAEFLATTIFVFIVTMVLTSLNGAGTQIVTVSLAIGLAISVLVQIFGPISGAHINPAVTIGILVKGGLCPLRALLYIVAQYLGGILGAALTYGITPKGARADLGNLGMNPALNVGQGFACEMIFTMLLVFTVLASTSKDNNRGDFGYANALAIGLSITVSHLVTIIYTGSGINPARALAPAVVTGTFQKYHWIYWVGPFVGAVVAGVVYRFVLKPEESGYTVTNCSSNFKTTACKEGSVTVNVNN